MEFQLHSGRHRACRDRVDSPAKHVERPPPPFPILTDRLVPAACKVVEVPCFFSTEYEYTRVPQYVKGKVGAEKLE